MAFSIPQAAEPGDDVEVEPFYSYRRSVSVSAFSLLGNLALGYEHLVANQHGLLGEAFYGYYGPATGSWGVSATYRYHFEPGIEGLFIGVFGGYGEVQTEIELPDDGETVKHDVETPLGLVGANIGYRWQWGNGLALVARGGYGYPVLTDFEWSPEPNDKDMKSFAEAMFGLDLELSVGYSF